MYFSIGIHCWYIYQIIGKIIGIPMGSYAAPFFTNLFLYFYESKWMNELKTDESKWMNQLKRNDLIKVRKLWNTFRFIDDLGPINDDGNWKVRSILRNYS